MWKENSNIKRIIFIILIFPQVINGQKSPGDNYLRGLASYQQEMYDSALISFTISKGLDEKNAWVWYYSGLVYFQKGNYREAISDFLEAEKLQTGIASYMLAKTFARQNHIEKTLEYLDIHLRSNYKKSESTVLLDEDLSRFENHKEWLKFWKESKYYSGFDELISEADYLINSEDFIEAINLLSEGMKKNYRESPLRAKRAEVYIQMGNDGPALRDLNKAINGDRRNSSLYALRGAVNYRLKNFSQAAEDFEQALKYDPSSFGLYTKKAMTFSRNGNYDEAMENMQFYLEYFPSDDHAWYLYGKIHMESGDYLRALRSLNRALDLNKTKAEYYIARGESYYNSRTYKYADNDLSMALDLDPRNPDAYYIKGLIAVKQGDQDHACYCFRKAFRFGKKEAFNQIDKYCK